MIGELLNLVKIEGEEITLPYLKITEQGISLRFSVEYMAKIKNGEMIKSISEAIYYILANSAGSVHGKDLIDELERGRANLSEFERTIKVGYLNLHDY